MVLAKIQHNVLDLNLNSQNGLVILISRFHLVSKNNNNRKGGTRTFLSARSVSSLVSIQRA